MATVLANSRAAALRLYDLNGKSWTGIGVSSNGFEVSQALADAYTADLAARTDGAILNSLGNTCGNVDCGGTSGTRPTTVTVTPVQVPPPAPARTFEFSAGPLSGGLMWDFGDGSPPGGGNPVRHTYQNAGTYRVDAYPSSQSTCVGARGGSATVAA